MNLKKHDQSVMIAITLGFILLFIILSSILVNSLGSGITILENYNKTVKDTCVIIGHDTQINSRRYNPDKNIYTDLYFILTNYKTSLKYYHGSYAFDTDSYNNTIKFYMDKSVTCYYTQSTNQLDLYTRGFSTIFWLFTYILITGVITFVNYKIFIIYINYIKDSLIKRSFEELTRQLEKQNKKEQRKQEMDDLRHAIQTLRTKVDQLEKKVPEVGTSSGTGSGTGSFEQL